jgi:DnaJ-class molecular chaperone
VTKLPPNQNTKGSHHLKIKIKIPTKISPLQKQLFEEIARYEENNRNTGES